MEILGQWLHLWTAPRDRYVPPPPVRKLLIWGVVGLVVAGVVIVVGASLIDRGKEEGATRDARAIAQLVARETARLRVDQAPHAGRAAGRAPSRAGLIGDIERAITADARSRYRHRLLSAPVKRTSCIPFVRPAVPNPPQPPANASEGKYECLAETAEVGGPGGAPTGFPFGARVDFRHSSWVCCKINPRLG